MSHEKLAHYVLRRATKFQSCRGDICVVIGEKLSRKHFEKNNIRCRSRFENLLLSNMTKHMMFVLDLVYEVTLKIVIMLDMKSFCCDILLCFFVVVFFSFVIFNGQLLVFSKCFHAGFCTFSLPKKRLKLAEN